MADSKKSSSSSSKTSRSEQETKTQDQEQTQDQGQESGAPVNSDGVTGQPEVTGQAAASPEREGADRSENTPNNPAAGEQVTDYSRASEEALEERVGASPAQYPNDQDLQNRLDSASGTVPQTGPGEAGQE